VSALLVEALKQLNLQPGQSYQVEVNGREVKFRVTPDEPSSLADQGMMLPWAEFPPSASMRIVTVKHGPPMLPPPFTLAETDLAPGDLPDSEPE
jgi:hypothetical protein